MTKLISDYCVYIENHMPIKICDDLVDLFESVPSNKWNKTFNRSSGRPRFTEFDITKESNLNEELYRNICKYLIKAVEDYRTKVKFFSTWNTINLNFQNIRIKRYLSEDAEQFDFHVDVANDINEGRYLSFQWYLNDVADGGETEFVNFKIKPKKGTLLMFPPMWMFPHKGNSLNSGRKYILSTYLLYPEPKYSDNPLPKFKLFKGIE